jgi:hypothetical protein
VADRTHGQVAGPEVVSRSPVVTLFRAHRPDDGQVLRLLGELGQVGAQEHPRHRRLDRFERAAIGVTRLGVERIGLAGPSRHPKEDARLAAARVPGHIGRQGLDPPGGGGAEDARGREPHHLTAG